MLRNKTSKLIQNGTLLLGLTLIAAGCSQKAAYKSGIKDQNLIPLRYPQSAMTVGAMGWGKPGQPLPAFRPGPDNCSDELLEAMPTADAAWFGKEKSKEMFMGVVAKPGPDILSEVELASAQAGGLMKKGGSTFIDWGDLVEQSLDMQRMSEAIVRGWYNMPGEAISFDALAALRPDLSEYKSRPWMVQRSVMSEGLEYEVSSEIAGLLGAQAGNALYGKGTVTVGGESKKATTLTINKPMVIGFNTAELRKVDPPLPAIGMDAQGYQLSTHNFVWKVRGTNDTWEVQIDPTVLRMQAKRAGLEVQLAVPTQEKIEQVVEVVKTGVAVGTAIQAEGKLRSGSAGWRKLNEGSSFDANEMIRLNIDLQEPGFVYIFNKDSSGNAQILYPKASGQKLSIGEDEIRSGTFTFPTDVIGEEGMLVSDERGTESFIIITSKTRLPGVMDFLKLAAEAISAETASGNSATRSGKLTIPGIGRNVVGYASTTSDSPADPPAPYFGGMNGATLLTLNLNKVPTP
jgi:Domain of unknown function (DUF4384)